MKDTEASIEKNEETERPVPTAWRPVFSKIVDALVNRDYSLSSDIHGVASVSHDTACQIREYINDYGEDLVPLPSATWDSSVCIWSGNHWEVLVDLWTINEGRSDLALGAQVWESEDGYMIDVTMVYVP